MLPKNFQKFYEEEFARLLGEIGRKKEIAPLDAETGIKEVISKSIKALREDKKAGAFGDAIIVSEKTGEPIIPKKEAPVVSPIEDTEENLEK